MKMGAKLKNKNISFVLERRIKRFSRREFWMIKLSKIRLSLNFENQRIYSMKSAIFFIFYYVYKEKMFTIATKDGREAP